MTLLMFVAESVDSTVTSFCTGGLDALTVRDLLST
jgi:hypothetical protein